MQQSGIEPTASCLVMLDTYAFTVMAVWAWNIPIILFNEALT